MINLRKKHIQAPFSVLPWALFCLSEGPLKQRDRIRKLGESANTLLENSAFWSLVGNRDRKVRGETVPQVLPLQAE